MILLANPFWCVGLANLSRGRYRARRALIAATTPLALTLGSAVQAEETEQQLEGFSRTELGLTEESPAETDKPLISEDQLPAEGKRSRLASR